MKHHTMKRESRNDSKSIREKNLTSERIRFNLKIIEENRRAAFGGMDFMFIAHLLAKLDTVFRHVAVFQRANFKYFSYIFK